MRPNAEAIAICCCGRTNGNVLTVYRRTVESKRWPFVMMIGPDWPCLLVTYTLVLSCWLAFLVALAPRLHPGVVAGGAVCMLLTTFVLTLTACSDPGYVPKQSLEAVQEQRERWDAAFARWRAAKVGGGAAVEAAGSSEGGQTAVTIQAGHPAASAPSSSSSTALPAMTMSDLMESPPQLFDERGLPLQDLSQASLCGLCNVYRSRGTAHCYDCNSCVRELDHHCPWTGKCIGVDNLRPFYAFLWCITGSIVYVVACVLAWLLGCIATNTI